MPQFDLEKTAAVAALFQVPREQRDADWIARFFAAVPDASMATSEQQVFRGPDGLPYFDLHLPEPEKPFETFCMTHLADHCTSNGFGIVFHPQDQPPQWVFSYGDLWHLRTHGKLMLRHTDGSLGGEGDQVMVGTPSDRLLPPWARTVLKSFLEFLKVADPSVVLVVSQKATPAECLIFNLHPEDYPPDIFQRNQQMLAWFIPPHLSLAFVGRGSQFESSFVRL